MPPVYRICNTASGTDPTKEHLKQSDTRSLLHGEAMSLALRRSLSCGARAGWQAGAARRARRMRLETPVSPCGARAGWQAGAARRARRMRLETPVSPANPLPEGEGLNRNSL